MVTVRRHRGMQFGSSQHAHSIHPSAAPYHLTSSSTAQYTGHRAGFDLLAEASFQVDRQ